MINTAHLILRRYAFGYSQRELADEIGITKDHMSRIECGRVSPRLSTIVALCRALETEPSKVILWD
jgi:transcriptional regulator with XRE-family HTH domain